MDSYNPFTVPEDPFDEEVQQPVTDSQDSKIYNLLKPATMVATSIVFVLATVSLFTRPSTEIIVIQETLDKPEVIRQEPIEIILFQRQQLLRPLLQFLFLHQQQCHKT